MSVTLILYIYRFAHIVEYKYSYVHTHSQHIRLAVVNIAMYSKKISYIHVWYGLFNLPSIDWNLYTSSSSWSWILSESLAVS